MMQSMMFLRPKDDEPIDRIINIEHLATAWREEDGSTKLIVEGAHISMGMKFEDFLAEVQKLIAENYRVENENYVAWHNKRMKDTHDNLIAVMKEMLPHHD